MEQLLWVFFFQFNKQQHLFTLTSKINQFSDIEEIINFILEMYVSSYCSKPLKYHETAAFTGSRK